MSRRYPKNYRKIILWILVGAAFIAIFLVGYALSKFDIFNQIVAVKSSIEGSVDGNENEIYAWLYYLTAWATVSLGIIAYIQLDAVNKELEANFFLDLEKLWMLESHAQARFIISELCRTNKNEEISPTDFFNKLLYLKDSYLLEDRKKYRIIIDFLNLLELMGYYHHENYVSAEKFDSLYRDILVEYERLFDKEELTKLDNITENSFKHFRALVEEIKKEKNIPNNSN